MLRESLLNGYFFLLPRYRNDLGIKQFINPEPGMPGGWEAGDGPETDGAMGWEAQNVLDYQSVEDDYFGDAVSAGLNITCLPQIGSLSGRIINAVSGQRKDCM